MERRRAGRPAHEPSAATRQRVVTLVQAGEKVRDIAQALGLSAPTLRAHYAEELKAPRPQINFPFAADTPSIKRPAMPGAGRPPHVATDETRRRVEILVAGGMNAWQIAAALEVSEPTLRLHYDQELASGRSKRRAEMLEALFKAGVEGGNVSAQKAWLQMAVELDEVPPAMPPERDMPMGKKERQAIAAQTAHEGTEWAKLLPN